VRRVQRRQGLLHPFLAPLLLAGAGSLLAAALLVGPAAAAARGPAAASTKVAGRAGSLEILNPFLPDPATPSVAAIYLTVKDTGPRADALLGATSPVAPVVLLMTENDHGSFDSMGPLRELRVPAHGQASLVPGRDHVMLEQPSVAFKVGETVPVTLRFERAGTVTISVPVVPLSWILRR
jgi:periplasmic copper chaperone A